MSFSLLLVEEAKKRDLEFKKMQDEGILAKQFREKIGDLDEEDEEGQGELLSVEEEEK